MLGAGAGALGFSGFCGLTSASGAETLQSQQKRVVVFWLAGGVSQLETWDPKPGAVTGGPFQAIPTSVPGVHICELLPFTAQQMHHLALIRGINTAEDDHGKGAYIMHTGYRQTPGFEYPYIGPAMAAQLTPRDSPLPGYCHVGGAGAATESAFLGPRFAPVNLPASGMPANFALPGLVSVEADARRRALRSKLSSRFAEGRRGAETSLYNASHDQAASLLARRDIFDFTQIPAAEVERYGHSEFGQQCLRARRLIENGVTFVQVSHSNYDTHSENFNFHIEQLGEFDRPFATFLADLSERGLLQHTLVIVMSEFGRTPNINHLIGRDHWSKAWSVAVAGAGIKGGAVHGQTNAEGTEVIDGQVNGGHLFHTYYRAVGIDSTKDFYDGDRPVHKADPATGPITEILA
jgi:hypothetical protein